MRIAVLADVHGNVLALEAVLADMAAYRPDCIVDLGDGVAGPLWPAETLARLDKLGAVTVRGNHERQLIDRSIDDMGPSDRYTYHQLSAAERNRLGALPTTRRLDKDVLLCHGTPQCDMTYLTDTVVDGYTVQACPFQVDERLAGVEAALVLCGHSHQQRLLRTNPTGVWVCNPGSVGLPAYEDAGHNSVSATPHARYALIDWGGGAPDVTMRHVVYDWEAAAARAAHNNRPDWARALRTGTLGSP